MPSESVSPRSPRSRGAQRSAGEEAAIRTSIEKAAFDSYRMTHSSSSALAAADKENDALSGGSSEIWPDIGSPPVQLVMQDWSLPITEGPPSLGGKTAEEVLTIGADVKQANVTAETGIQTKSSLSKGHGSATIPISAAIGQASANTGARHASPGRPDAGVVSVSVSSGSKPSPPGTAGSTVSFISSITPPVLNLEHLGSVSQPSSDVHVSLSALPPPVPPQPALTAFRMFAAHNKPSFSANAAMPPHVRVRLICNNTTGTIRVLMRVQDAAASAAVAAASARAASAKQRRMAVTSRFYEPVVVETRAVLADSIPGENIPQHAMEDRAIEEAAAAKQLLSEDQVGPFCDFPPTYLVTFSLDLFDVSSHGSVLSPMIASCSITFEGG